MTPFLPNTREWLLEELLEDTRPAQPCIEENEASTQAALKMLREMVAVLHWSVFRLGLDPRRCGTLC